MFMNNFQPTPALRAAVFLAGDLMIWTAALVGAFLIRFDGTIPPNYLRDIPNLLAVLIPIKLGWHAIYRLYQITWRSVGLAELMNVLKANILTLLTITAVVVLFRSVDTLADFPRSVMVLDFVLATGGVILFRAGRRGLQLQRESFNARRRKRNGTRLLIVGAGAAGQRITQGLAESPKGTYHPIGFIDDDPAKQGAYIHGLKVLGRRIALPRVVRDHAVEEIIVAIPSASPMRLREIFEDVRKTGVQRIKVLPGMHEWLAGRASLKDVRDVNLEDLLGREPVRIQYDALREYFSGKRVLVTGAAGSIGSELVRQLSRFDLEQIVAADIDESGLVELEQELRREVPETPLLTSVSDVRDIPKAEWLVSSSRPHLIFHAAAYKHVPIMEREVGEAVKTNIFGTFAVGEAALRHGVETFVFISTDKAVNPISVMGETKRVGELIVQALNLRRKTRFLAVRFGNVLGSRGSLIPILQEQIRRGGPVTITHPNMTRYFMSVSEAVLLVLQTPMLDTSGRTYVLEMGKPIRIYDLVQALIRLSGLEVDRDIPIVYSGIRPGEKLEEELFLDVDQVKPTPFEHILEIATPDEVDEITLRLVLRELEQLVRVIDNDGARVVLQRMARSAFATSGSDLMRAERPRASG